MKRQYTDFNEFQKDFEICSCGAKVSFRDRLKVYIYPRVSVRNNQLVSRYKQLYEITNRHNCSYGAPGRKGHKILRCQTVTFHLLIKNDQIAKIIPININIRTLQQNYLNNIQFNPRSNQLLAKAPNILYRKPQFSRKLHGINTTEDLKRFLEKLINIS